jgi:c-di-GMP-binding flagellar brake protein YcgR
MTTFEIMTGSAITALFDNLIQHETLLKLTLIDTEYENLTRILKMVDHQKKTHLVIGIPEGFETTAADLDVWQIHFEFNGPDQIKYGFTTVGGEIVDNHLYMKAPQEIERQQRRELFRIDAPKGTRIHFSKAGNRIELEVINTSIGGSLAAWVQTRSDMPENSALTVAQRLEDVALVFPAEILQRPIHVLNFRHFRHFSVF